MRHNDLKLRIIRASIAELNELAHDGKAKQASDLGAILGSIRRLEAEARWIEAHPWLSRLLDLLRALLTAVRVRV
jgi:hypothetical protein